MIRAADPAHDVVRPQLGRDRRARLAGVPAVRGEPRMATSGSSAASSCIPTTGSSSPARCATSARLSGSITAIGSSPRTGGRPTSPARPGGQRRMHVHHARADRSDRSLRRGLPDGLRGRRLLPARVAGWLPRGLLAGGGALPPRVGHPRHEVGERERASQRVFWERWVEFFDARNVRERRTACCASST